MWQQTIVKLIAMSVACGVVCGVLWDFFKILRIAFSTNDGPSCRGAHFVIVFFQDVVFCILSGCLFSVMLYYGNEGRFRSFAALGAISGFAAYRVSFGVLIVGLSKKLFLCLHKLTAKIKGFLSRTLKRIKQLLKKRIIKIKEAFKIGKHQNCKLVDGKKRSEGAFHKGKSHIAAKRKKSAG